MQSNTKKILIGLVILAVALLVVPALLKIGPGKYDQFATCLKDKGTTFYGAFWCPHCQRQKAMFSNSAKLLPYKECSTPDGHGQLPVCIDKKITGYPTWEFADGSRLDGEISLEQLAEKTGCELPK